MNIPKNRDFFLSKRYNCVASYDIMAWDTHFLKSTHRYHARFFQKSHTEDEIFVQIDSILEKACVALTNPTQNDTTVYNNMIICRPRRKRNKGADYRYLFGYLRLLA